MRQIFILSKIRIFRNKIRHLVVKAKAGDARPLDEGRSPNVNLRWAGAES